LTTDAALMQSLPNGTFSGFSPFQSVFPILPGLMISIIDPQYKHLLKVDKDGKPKWNDVPEMARVSVRCLKTPGHTQDSVSLVLTEGEKGIFTGDTVLGSGTAMFTDLASYMVSLKVLLALKPTALYPGHGPHVGTAEESAKHISDYITHREQREAQIVKILQEFWSDPTRMGKTIAGLLDKYKKDAAAEEKYKHEFLTGKEWTVPEKEQEQREKQEKEQREKDGRVEDKFKDVTFVTVALITRLIYNTNDDKLIWAAGNNIMAHLEKLEKEGKVKRVSVTMPKIIGGKVTEPEDQEGWEWAGDDDAEQ